MLGERISNIETRIARAHSDHGGILTVIEWMLEIQRPYRTTDDNAPESDSAAEIVECISGAVERLTTARKALERHMNALGDSLEPLLEQEAEENRIETGEQIREYYQMVGD